MNVQIAVNESIPAYKQNNEQFSVAVIDVFFNEPVFFNGVSLPNLDEFLAEKSTNVNVMQNAISLECTNGAQRSIAASSEKNTMYPLGAAAMSPYKWVRAVKDVRSRRGYVAWNSLSLIVNVADIDINSCQLFVNSARSGSVFAAHDAEPVAATAVSLTPLRRRARTMSVSMSPQDISFLEAQATVDASYIPFKDVLMAPLVSYISEYVTSRAPDYIKHRIRSDLFRRVLQKVISTQIFSGHGENEKHIPLITEYLAGDMNSNPKLKGNAQDEAAADGANPMESAAAAAGGGAGSLGDAVKGAAGGAAGALGGIGDAVKGAVGDAAGSLGDAVKGAVGNAAGALGDAAGSLGDAVKGAVGGAGGSIGGIIGEIVDTVTSAAGEVADSVSGAVGEVADSVTGAVGGDAGGGESEGDAGGGGEEGGDAGGEEESFLDITHAARRAAGAKSRRILRRRMGRKPAKATRKRIPQPRRTRKVPLMRYYPARDPQGNLYRPRGENFPLFSRPTVVNPATGTPLPPMGGDAVFTSFLVTAEGEDEAGAMIGDRTLLKPDGCLSLPIIDYLIKSLTNVVSVSSTERLVTESHELIAGLIAPSLLDFLIPELQQALARTSFPLTNTALQQVVPMMVKRLAPQSILKYTTPALTDALVRGVTHVVVPTLSHTLTDASKTEPLCYYCHYIDPRYCYLCPKNRPVPKSSQSALHLYTIDNYVSYYSDHYADFYKGDEPLTSKRPTTEWPLGE